MLDDNQQGTRGRTAAPRTVITERHAAVAAAFGDDAAHARRLAEYMGRGWFLPSDAIMARAGQLDALPISCVMTEAGPGVDGVVGAWNDVVQLSRFGAGSYWGRLPEAGEGVAGVTSLLPAAESLLAAADGAAQGAAYLPMSHPEIAAFVDAGALGGTRLQRGVLVPHAFMRAVGADEAWVLRAPDTGGAVGTVQARALWSRLLQARSPQARGRAGAPHVVFTDHVNNARPEHHKLAGLPVRASSTDGAATLPTGEDHHGRARMAVAVGATLNLEHWMAWHDHLLLVEDVMRFLDNAMQDFADRAPDSLADARYAALRERSVGLGVAGFHAFLQSQGAAYESVVARAWNKRMMRHIRSQADGASRMLAEERGACPDAADYGTPERFSHKLALAPHGSAAHAWGTSPGTEPAWSNCNGGRNPHLCRLLAGLGQDTDTVWASIAAHGGSAAHIQRLTDHQRAVFRTAQEVSPWWVVEHAADRAPSVCQAEPVQLFLPTGTPEQHLHGLHWLAWTRGVKTLAGGTIGTVEGRAD